MGTKQHTIIVLGVSVLIALATAFFPWKTHSADIKSRVYESANGWGYDILVNNKLLIHQESIPGIAGHRGFSEKKQAAQTACLIINKMKRGQLPTITKFEIYQICPLIAINAEQGKHQ